MNKKKSHGIRTCKKKKKKKGGVDMDEFMNVYNLINKGIIISTFLSKRELQ